MKSETCEPFRKFLVPTTFAVRTENCDPEVHIFHLNQVRRLDFGVHMAVTGIGVSGDHLLKIRGFRLIPVAAGGHLGSKIARTLPNLKGGMYSSPEIHGFSPTRISVRCFSDFSTDTDFRNGENVTAGRSTFGSRSGPMGTKLAHVQFNSSRSIFSNVC